MIKMLFYQTEDAVDFVHELINFNPLKWYVTFPQSMSDSLPRTITTSVLIPISVETHRTLSEVQRFCDRKMVYWFY